MKSTYDNLYEIDNNFAEHGIHFCKIEGVSVMGDIMVGAPQGLIYYAMTNVRQGEDDPYTGEGFTPSEAIRNLLKVLNEAFPTTKST